MRHIHTEDRNNLIHSMGLPTNKVKLPALDNEIVSGNEEMAIRPLTFPTALRSATVEQIILFTVTPQDD
jgi:hypothetical protein